MVGALPQLLHSESPAPRLSMKAVVSSIVGLWACYFLLITLRGSVVGLDFGMVVVWRRLLVTVAGIGITLGLWLVIRLVEDRALWTKIVVALFAAMPAAVLIAQVNQLMFQPLEEAIEKRIGEERGIALRRDEAGNLLVDVPSQVTSSAAPNSVVIAPPPTDRDRWRQVFDQALNRYFLLLAWAALYLALVAGAQAQAAQRREDRFRNAAKAAELRSLRYQVNPHFLFNALNSLSALVMTDRPAKAEEMIHNISRFYRHSLTDDPTGEVSLDDEFDLQRHYLEIEQVRFPERLRTRYDLPDELASCRVPGMILQPLVENSVKYGVSASVRPVTISIAAREEYGRLVLTVTDDGPGAAAGSAGGFGIGLANVRDRLAARFGNEASVATGPILDGYETEIRIPMVRNG